MKTLLHFPRGNRAKHTLLCLALLAAAFFGAASSASATSYHLLTSKNLTWTTNSSKPITVAKNGTGADDVSASLTGSSKFTLSPSYVYWPMFDSSGYDTVRTFTVSFSSSIHDTNYAKVVLIDSVRTDTITLVGIGTAGSDTTTFDYTLTSTYSAFAYPSTADSITFGNTVKNHHTTPIDVTATLHGSSFWTINGSSTVTFNLNGTTDHTTGRSLNVRYIPHGLARDSCYVSFSCDSGHHQTATWWMIAVDTSKDTTSTDTSSFDYSLSTLSSAIMYSRRYADSVFFGNTLKNHHTTRIDVTATVHGSAYWTINGGSSATFNLNGTTDHTSGRSIYVRYIPHSVLRDSCYISFSCDSGHHQTANWTMLAVDSTTDTSNSPTISAPQIGDVYLGVVNQGDSACATVTIRNPNSAPIRITSLTDTSYYSTGWHTSGKPSLPHTIAGHDSISYTACWKVPSNFWSESELYINLTCTDTSGGQTKYASGYVWGEAPWCVTILNDTPIVLSDVMLGGHVDGQIKFIMRKDSVLHVSSIYMDSGSFTILSPTFPLTVHVGDTVTIRYRFTPSSVGYRAGMIEFQDGTCGAFMDIHGRTVSASADSLQISGDQSDLLTFQSDTTAVTRSFIFHNGTGSTLRVTDVHFTDGTHFHINSVWPHGTPDTLANGANLVLSLTFDADSSGFYTDSLIIVTANGIIANSFNVQAIMKGTRTQHTNAVAELTSGPAMLELSPNPTHGVVTIGIVDAPRAAIEIYDLLGNRVTVASTTSSYSWDASGLSAGIYIVRATGVDANGQRFVISKRLVLDR